MGGSAASDMGETLRRGVRAWTKSDLEARWSPASLRSAVLRGSVTRILPGIYCATEHSQSFATRAHAAHLMCGEQSVIIGEGAASLYDWCDVPQAVVIATPYGVSRTCPEWLRIRRFEQRLPTAWWGACPIAMPAWAAVTAFATAPVRDRDRFLYRAVQSRSVMPQDLMKVAAAIPRLRGRRHFEAVVAAIREGSESHLETTGLRKVFNTAKFRDFVRQHWVTTPGGSYRLDMFHPPSRTAVELDGALGHTKPHERQRNINRDVNVARLGILTMRFSAADINQMPQWCREAVLDVIAARS
jgi:very-short-patch-repair endonuclease